MASNSGSLRRPQTGTRRQSTCSARPAKSVVLTRSCDSPDDVSILGRDTRSVVTSHSSSRAGRIKEIRQKEAVILYETERLREESAVMERDKAKLSSLRSKRDKLTVTVVDLEGQLTDYNLAMDRANMQSVLPSELEDANAVLAKTNGKAEDELTRALLDVEEQEQNLHDLEDQLSKSYKAIEKRIIEEGNQKQLRRFHSLKTYMEIILKEKQRWKEEIMATNCQVLDFEDSAKGQRYREHAALSAKASRLKVVDLGLSEEMKALELPISEAREVLMAATEEKERSIYTCDIELDELDLNIENLLALRDNLLSELATNELQQQTFGGKLHEADGLNDDGDCCNDDDDATSVYHERIAQTMQGERTTLKVSINRLRNQLDFSSSNGGLDDHQALSVGEVDNATGSTNELQALDDTRMQLEDELVEYDDLVGLQTKSDQAKADLKRRKDNLTQKLAQAKPEKAKLSAACKANEAKLESDENWSSLRLMKKKQTDQKQEIISLEKFVEVKGRETEYESIKSACLVLARGLNKELIGNLM